ncbi:MAG TPA: HU family DNA-binding protein [Baekduia sp.]|nr:HU family DNA-binding protein [Baekduia sp.]
MNKSELVEHVVGRAGLSHGQAAGGVEATLAAIEAELATGGEVAITGFGRFSVAAARRAQLAHRRADRDPGGPCAALLSRQPIKRAVAAA